MAYERIDREPQNEEFTALEQHQEQTPGTFFGGKPVLHLQCGALVRIARADLEARPDFAALTGRISGDEEIEILDIGVWVTSRHLTLWSISKTTGIQIPYPTITIHAQEGNAVLLELNLSDDNTADEDLEFLQLRIVPSTPQGSPTSTEAPVQQLYDAISACQELNPDPDPSDGGEEGGVGGFDETAPGATGWITSENMADFMDENGNFRMPEGMTVVGGAEDGADINGHADGLGEGAGRRRGADELVDGDGEVEEAKWQRTG